jgi:Holliday junction resolvasome RuvABC DNA-binding subunit
LQDKCAHVREDALSLYGFLTKDEKELFEKLIGVSGIGPTLAVKVLSGVAAPDIILAIQRGEVDRLVRIPGVGEKLPSAWCWSCETSCLPSAARNPADVEVGVL